ncbi:protein crumbs-like [Branchiostoma lanceolatum]|uniref:protein crumbs-like n=1 Tax=Branchiostoma lanceolatum TaxID=7740 RepID=UPI003453BEE6
MGFALLAAILLLVGSSAGQDCVDDNDNCPGWASSGECKANPGYMETSCRLSCGICTQALTTAQPLTTTPPPTSYPGVPCVDESEYCAEWEAEGQCTTNKFNMYTNCRATCGLCDGSVVCEDLSPFCPLWADYGRCGSGWEEDSTWTMNTCPKSCGLCEFDCWSSPCQHGGTCYERYGVEAYSCTCVPQTEPYTILWTGVNCEINIDDCQSLPWGSETPCYNGGTCVDGIGTYTCLCPAGTYGRLCDSDCVIGDGANYRGDIRSNSDGYWCGYWSLGRQGYSAEAYPDAGLDRNYCRNPDGSYEGPFCIANLFNQKTPCEVATCDCYTDGTTSYRGQVNVTRIGTPCLDWADEMVQLVLDVMGVTEAQKAAAGLDGNYCRDPTGEGTLECFVDAGYGASLEACRIDECYTQYYVPPTVTCYSCAADEDCDQNQADLVTGGGQSRETQCESGACWVSWKSSVDGRYGGHIRSCQHEDLVCSQEYMEETCTENGDTKECLKCCQSDRCNGEVLQGSLTSSSGRASMPNMVMLLACLAAMFFSR